MAQLDLVSFIQHRISSGMPTVLRWKGIGSSSGVAIGSNPPHVHVKKGAAEAKVWLDPVAVNKALDLRDHEVNEILRKVRQQRSAFIEAWHDHFGH